MRPQTPIETADLAWAFGSLCGLLRVPFDARLFLLQFPPPSAAGTLTQAAAALGLELTPWRGARADLGRAPAPLLALRRRAEGGVQLALVLSADRDAVLVTTREDPPAPVGHGEFLASVGAELLQVARRDESVDRPDNALTSRRFGLSWFVPELLRHRAVWRDVLAASLVLQLIALATPLCTQVVIDKVVVHHAQSTLLVIVAALAIFLAFNAALGYARQYLMLYAGNRIDAALGQRSFEHLLRLPPRYFEHRPTGTLIARLHGVETVREFLTGAATAALLDVPFVLVFLALMFWYSVPLTLIALGAIALLALLSFAVTPLLRARINRQFLAGARNQAFLTEHVAAMETVKALQMEPQLAARYGRILADYLRASFGTRQLANAYAVTAAALEQGLALAVLAAGAWLVMSTDGFTIGMLVAFQMFSSRLAQPAMRLASLWQEFQQAAIAVQRLGDLMDAPPEPWAVRPGHVHVAAGRIDVEGLTFRYTAEQAPVLENFDLHIEPGACAALVGPSGCGKSTLARLLLGFCFPTSGSVKVDGYDTRHLSANELRLQFGVVPQETVLFSGSVYDNLVLAQPHASFAEVVEACRLAEIHDFVESLPQGYQSLIGERGTGLSGGQKQRLAIARALLRRPRVLLFDEATASLDRDTAEALGRTIGRLRGRITLVFIAHHLPDSLAVDMTVRFERARTENRHGLADATDAAPRVARQPA